MNIIRHPTASLANVIAERFISNYSIQYLLDSSLHFHLTQNFTYVCFVRDLVMPIFLAIELVFKQIPLHLTLYFTANQQQIDESKENIKKLANAILCPFNLYRAFICGTDWSEEEKISISSSYTAFSFMSSSNQERFILDNPYLFKYASDEVQNNREFALLVARNRVIPNSIIFPKHLRNDPQFMLEAIRINPNFFMHASYDLKNSRDFALSLVRMQRSLFQFLPQNLKNDPEILTFHVSGFIQNELCAINGKRYFPKALTPELKTLQLPDPPENASIDHLEICLRQFIDDLNHLVAQDAGKLASVRNELQLPQNTDLEACIAKLREYHTRLFERVKNKIAYKGTPQAGSQELVQFYEQIEFHLRHLDAFFSRDENQLPEAIVERVQLLQTQSACGARFQAELEQLFSLNCLSHDAIGLDKQLAIIASLEAKKAIEAITPNRNVHHINVKMFQLNQFLVGHQVARDQLGYLFDFGDLFLAFFRQHTSTRLVSAIQESLKIGSELEVSFTEYLKENFLLELSENEIAEIPMQAQESLEENKSVKIQRFEEFLKAKAENNQQRMRFIDLPQEEASCADVEEYKQLLETKKNSYIEVISEEISEDKQINKLYAEYFDGNPETGEGSMKWKPSIIAMALKKMGILEEIN